MSLGALIGALRVTLGIDVSEFEKGTTKAQAQMRGFQREFAKTGKKWQEIGRDLSTYVTVPVLGIGAAIIKTAGDFEAGMNRVGISTQATGKQMAEMKELALQIGSETTKSASEAADAMDMLAKAGISTKDILNGAAKAAVSLSIAAGSELDPAAAAITDSMTLFKQKAADLPEVINQITGAVNESKFEFGDFQMGMSQAGGVASSAGVNFKDFTATLAATAAQFSSGSDAGTSFKNFLTRLSPETKKQVALFKEYKLSFYEANGEMKSMGEIAQMLQDKFGNLTAQDRTAVFKELFGVDAMRTAIGLMQQGAKGMEDMKARIDKTDATAQAEARMKGFNGQMEQLTGALETLAIRIADSGLLEAMSNIVMKVTEWVDWLGKASPTTLKWITIIAGVAAAMGPLALVFGTAIRTVGLLLPLISKLGPVFLILRSGIGYLIPVITGLGRAMMLMMLNPVGLAITAVGALYLAWKNWDKIKPIVLALYETVKTYVLDKLNVVWDAVKSKVDAVKGWFFGLYDAVVGHSYIPDMVDEIGQHMARLQQELVNPAKEATSEAAQAFDQMRQTVSSILDRLFPEIQADNTFKQEVKILTEYMEKMGFTAKETAEAIARLRRAYHDEKYGKQETEVEKLDPSMIDDAQQDVFHDTTMTKVDAENKKVLEEILGRTRDKTIQMAQAWADMAYNAVGSLREMVRNFKSGDILGGIQGIVDLVSQVAGAIKSIKGLGSTTGGSGSGSNGGGGHSPGFSTGGSFKVGGSGGVDSQLIRLRATPGEMIDVRRGDQMGSRSPVIVKVVANDYFDAKVDSIARPIGDEAAVRGAMGGANISERRAARQARGRLA